MGIELDKDIASTMTEEELAAINDEELSPDEIASMKGIAEGGDDDEDDDDEDEPVALPVEGKKVENPPAADPAPVAPAEAADENFRPAYQASLAEDYDARAMAVTDELKALAKSFKDGDIDFDKYNEESQSIYARRESLTQEKLRVDVLNDMNFQQWQDSKSAAFKSVNEAATKADGIDYSTDDGKFNVLNKHFTNIETDPAYAGKSARFMLDLAHRLAKAELGIESKPVAPAVPADPLKAARELRKPPIDAAPKTLAQVPGGDGPGDVFGEFADVDSLEGMDLEDAVAKMTPAQRDRYLKAA